MDMSQFANLLTSPPAVFTLAAGLFLVLLRSPWPWTRAGGSILAVAVLAALALAFRDAERRLGVLDSERLPILVLALSSAGAVWVAMRQASAASEPRNEEPEAWRGVSPVELFSGAVVLVLVALVAFLIGAPLAPELDPVRPVEELPAPWFMLGLQELLRYFDPWVPVVLLPLVTVLGLLALPHLDVPLPVSARGPAGDKFEERRDVVYFFLFVWFLLVLLPMVGAVFGRGAAPEVPVGLARPFSATVWGVLGGDPPRPAWLRELPSVLVLGLYFFVMPRQLPRWKPTRVLLGRYVKRLGRRRFLVAMAYMQLWMLVPLKMYAHWLLGIGYFVYLPELGFNF